MALTVRLMTSAETQIIIEYFHNATPEHLELLGVDPTRLPPRNIWQQYYDQELARPVAERNSLQVIWLLNSRPIGFSTCDKIIRGERANMHLHIVEPDLRVQGLGTECVRQSVDIYFELLQLKRLYCEPNAFNAAPNRTAQKAGFKFVKTHMTVPGTLNYRQAVTQWVFER
jgi:RimJ/RimL family protein N-acetyltransferase